MPPTSPVAALLASRAHLESWPPMLAHPEAVEAYLARRDDPPVGRNVKPKELLERARRKDLTPPTRQALVEEAIRKCIDQEVRELSFLVTDLLRRGMVQPTTVVVRHLQEQLRLHGAQDLEVMRARLADGDLIHLAGSAGTWLSSLAIGHLAAQYPGSYPLLPRQLVHDLIAIWPSVQAAWRARWCAPDATQQSEPRRRPASAMEETTTGGEELVVDLRLLTGDTPWDMDFETLVPAAPTREEPWLAPPASRSLATVFSDWIHPQSVSYIPGELHTYGNLHAWHYIKTCVRDVDYLDELQLPIVESMLDSSAYGGVLLHMIMREGTAPLGPGTQLALQEALASARTADHARYLADIAKEHWIRFPAASSVGLLRGILQAKARYKSVNVESALQTVAPCTPETAGLWWELVLTIAVQEQRSNFEMWMRQFLQAQTAHLTIHGFDATHCRVPPIGVWEHYGHQLSAGPRMFFLRDAPHLARVEGVNARAPRRRR